jgi:hypothetical protein
LVRLKPPNNPKSTTERVLRYSFFSKILLPYKHKLCRT